MRISDWSSDVCSSDLPGALQIAWHAVAFLVTDAEIELGVFVARCRAPGKILHLRRCDTRSQGYAVMAFGRGAGARQQCQRKHRRYAPGAVMESPLQDRKSTRLNSSH